MKNLLGKIIGCRYRLLCAIILDAQLKMHHVDAVLQALKAARFGMLKHKYEMEHLVKPTRC